MPNKVNSRINFGNIKEIITPPNLIEIQVDSYHDFLQAEISPEKRESMGLEAVFNEIFPGDELRRKGRAQVQPL